MIYIHPKFNWVLRDREMINIENTRRRSSNFMYDKIDHYESSMYDITTRRGFNIIVGQQAKIKVFKDGKEKYEKLYKLNEDDVVVLFKSKFNVRKPKIKMYKHAIRLCFNLFCENVPKKYYLEDYEKYRKNHANVFRIPPCLPPFFMKKIVRDNDIYCYAFLKALRKYYPWSKEVMDGVFKMKFHGSDIATELNLLCLKLGIFSFTERIGMGSKELIIDTNAVGYPHIDKIKKIVRKKFVRKRHHNRLDDLICLRGRHNINGFELE